MQRRITAPRSKLDLEEVIMLTTPSNHKRWLALLIALQFLAWLPITTNAQLGGVFDEAIEAEVEDGWTIRKVDGVEYLMFDLPIHPQPEARPALKHRFIPDRHDQVDGNAAIFYLKALGFFEETAARRELDRFEQENWNIARQLGEDDYPPYTWMKTAPNELPVAEVKQYTNLLNFQPALLREASKRRRFDLNRNLQQEESPLTVLLPDIQVMRQLGRYQTLRLRLALAENRIEDAIETVGHTYALAHHLGQDELFVPNLVGGAIAGYAWKDTAHLLSHPQTPNLYWAYATLPRPLIDMKDASSYERQFLFEQVKCLKEVTDDVKTEGYWQDFLTRFELQLAPVLNEGGFRADGPPDVQRTITVAHMAAAFPGAKRFLIEQERMTEEQIEKYPRLQTVLLAIRRYYEYARDEQFKWDFVPYHKAKPQGTHAKRFNEDSKRYGLITEPANLILPALLAIRAAQTRTEQQIALAQTVEAIRVYAAEHGRQLPRGLEDLRLPAPNDPVTGNPFSYDFDGIDATIKGKAASNQSFQLNLSIAN